MRRWVVPESIELSTLNPEMLNRKHRNGGHHKPDATAPGTGRSAPVVSLEKGLRMLEPAGSA